MSTTEQQTEVRAAIETATRQLTDALGSGMRRCASLYTAQGAMLPPNADIAWGRQADPSRSARIFDAGLTAFRVESLEVESAGDLAYEMGATRCTQAITTSTRESMSSSGSSRPGNGESTATS